MYGIMVSTVFEYGGQSLGKALMLVEWLHYAKGFSVCFVSKSRVFFVP